MPKGNLDGIVDKIVAVTTKAEQDILRARYAFSFKDITVSNVLEFEEVAASFMNFVYVRGEAKSRVDPKTLDRKIAFGRFDRIVSSVYGEGETNGLQRAVNAALTGEERGLQGVFDKVADAIISEMTKKLVSFVIQSEMHPLKYGKVKRLARQLRRRAEYSKVPHAVMMMSWETMVGDVAKRRRELRLKLGPYD